MTQHFLLTIDPDMVDWARAQFAITAIYHWLFVPLTLGLALIMGIMETVYYRTKNVFWKDTAKFWQKLFGVNFAMGVATGIILEFEFGTNWSNDRGHRGLLLGVHLRRRHVLRLEKGVGRFPSCLHMAYWARCYVFGLVDPCSQLMDAVPRGV